jgi:hypothetical protein
MFLNSVMLSNSWDLHIQREIPKLTVDTRPYDLAYIPIAHEEDKLVRDKLVS